MKHSIGSESKSWLDNTTVMVPSPLGNYIVLKKKTYILNFEEDGKTKHFFEKCVLYQIKEVSLCTRQCFWKAF